MLAMSPVTGHVDSGLPMGRDAAVVVIAECRYTVGTTHKSDYNL
jgi:hypothetical protein